MTWPKKHEYTTKKSKHEYCLICNQFALCDYNCCIDECREHVKNSLNAEAIGIEMKKRYGYLDINHPDEFDVLGTDIREIILERLGIKE